jgi:hypothetical protein
MDFDDKRLFTWKELKGILGWPYSRANQRKEVLRMVGEVACGDHAFPWCVAPTDMNNDT